MIPPAKSAKRPDEKPIAHSPEVLAGAIQSSRSDAITTIWRDGQVIREDMHGRARLMPSVNPILTPVYTT